MTAMALREILQRIDERKHALGLSEHAIVTQAGLHQDTIRNWRRALEQGRLDLSPRDTALSKIAQVLGVDAEWLRYGVETPGLEESAADGPSLGRRVLHALQGDAQPRNDARDTPGTIKVAIVDDVVQVAATVDRESIDRLIRRLEAAKAMIADE